MRASLIALTTGIDRPVQDDHHHLAPCAALSERSERSGREAAPHPELAIVTSQAVRLLADAHAASIVSDGARDQESQRPGPAEIAAEAGPEVQFAATHPHPHLVAEAQWVAAVLPRASSLPGETTATTATIAEMIDATIEMSVPDPLLVATTLILATLCDPAPVHHSAETVRVGTGRLCEDLLPLLPNVVALTALAADLSSAAIMKIAIVTQDHLSVAHHLLPGTR